MTNYLSFGEEFTINCIIHDWDEPVALICATDGCFGYVYTPMHFEALLLQTLVDADSIQDWQSAMREKMKQSASDDLSFAAILLGWNNFDALRDAMKERLNIVTSRYVEPLASIYNEVSIFKERLAQAEQQMADVKQGYKDCIERKKHEEEKVWAEYKREYEAFIGDADDGAWR